jgi:hypothetical protein
MSGSKLVQGTTKRSPSLFKGIWHWGKKGLSGLSCMFRLLASFEGKTSTFYLKKHAIKP